MATTTSPLKVRVAADNAAAKGCIGGVPVTGVDPLWFITEFEKFLDLCPEADRWSCSRVQSTMEALYLLDPEDLL